MNRRGPKVQNAERDLEIMRKLDAGASLKELAEEYGLSRPRICQIRDRHIRMAKEAR